MNTDAQINELLERGVAAVYPTHEFLAEGVKKRKLKLYLGVDPTGPTLHLGHMVPLFKLRQFQKLGHQVILLIGNFTAMIGDPTDKKAVRKKQTPEEVMENCKKYKEQASKILDFEGENAAEFKFNADWLAKMSFADVVELASHFTVQQMLERDMFEKRMKEEKPIYFHEFLYPLMQGYDSVAMEVDGEIGGNDQIFNMLAGRTLMKDMQNKEKFVLAMKLLADTNGVKMGKTEGNMLSFLDSAKDMFGKVMSWTDGMIVPGFELCTVVPYEKVKEVEERIKAGENPRDLKVELGKSIVEFFFSKEEAESVAEEFFRMFKDKGVPDEMPEIVLEDGFTVIDKRVLEVVEMSGSEAKRLVQQGGVKVDGEKVSDFSSKIEFKDKTELVLQFGKRKFVKIKK